MGTKTSYHKRKQLANDCEKRIPKHGDENALRLFVHFYLSCVKKGSPNMGTKTAISPTTQCVSVW